MSTTSSASGFDRPLRFIATRLSNALVVALVVPVLTLFLLGRAPGDYLSELAANPQVSTNTLAQLRTQYGIDQSLPVKYYHWLKNAAHGDLGFSLVYQRPITELIGARLWNTALLNALALLVAWSLGIAVSLVSVWPRRASWPGWLAGAAAIWMVSTPAVLVALVLLALAQPMGLPVGGMTSATAENLGPLARFGDVLRHLILPVAAVSVVWLPMVIRHTRSALQQSMREPYIVTARAKGLSRSRVLVAHALRNALNPLATFFGLSVSALLSASLPVEVVMGWPGLGQLTYDAVLKRDIFLVMDLAVIAALLLLAGNLVGDALLYLSDPRLASRRDAEGVS
jgi:peptide/nickel transport system permease protein